MKRLSLSIWVTIGVLSCAPHDEASVPDAELHPDFAADAERRSPLDPSHPLQLGTAPVDASETQLLALWWVNTFRVRAGLGPVGMVSTLNVAAEAHASFVMLNPDLYDSDQASVHREVEGHDGFFGEQFWDRISRAGYAGVPFREVIAYQARPSAAVAHWMETVYHRLPLLHPEVRHLGYGERTLGQQRINVLDLGAGQIQAPRIPSGIAWPPDGAIDVPVAWDGVENPAPPAPHSGFPSGPVISLTFNQDSHIELVETRVRQIGRPDGLALVVLTAKTDPNLGAESSVALYTEEPLEPGIRYEVFIHAVVDGIEISRRWTFRTRTSLGCNLLAQDCGAGQACYGKNPEEASCAWAGLGGPDAACGFQNDCNTGLTCVSGTCRRYCTLVPSSFACDAVCEAGHEPISLQDDMGVCANATAAPALGN